MLNKAILMGRLTKDPELKTTPSGVPVCTFALACERDFGAKGEERQADFFDIVTWRTNAEFASKYFRKGQLVAVTGRMQQRKWQDKEGNNRYSFEIVAEETHFAEKKSDSPSAGGSFTPPRSDNEVPAYNPSVASSYVDMSDDGNLPF